MGQEFVGDLGLFRRPGQAHRHFALFGHQRAVAQGEFLHLPDVVGEALGRGVDRRQAAADHHHGHAELQVGDGGLLRRAGQLQRHQEVRRLPHAARQPVRDVQHGRLAGAHAQRDVVEAHRPGIVHRQRGAAAEADAAEMGEFVGAPLQQQAHHLQVVLVPADGDAVLGHAAEPGHDAVVEVFEHRLDVAHRRCYGSKPSGSIFRPSIATMVWPSFIRWCARVNPAGPRPTIRTLRPLSGRGRGRRMSSGFQRVSSA